jgi:hypothetical protein
MEATNGDLAPWRKSTYSDGNGGNCVEVSGGCPVVVVRDTKDRAGAVLRFGANAWQRFAGAIKGGDEA